MIWISIPTGWHEGSDLDRHCADGDNLSWSNSAVCAGFVTGVRWRIGKCNESLQSRRQTAFWWVSSLGSDAVRYKDDALVRREVTDLNRLNQPVKTSEKGKGRLKIKTVGMCTMCRSHPYTYTHGITRSTFLALFPYRPGSTIAAIAASTTATTTNYYYYSIF